MFLVVLRRAGFAPPMVTPSSNSQKFSHFFKCFSKFSKFTKTQQKHTVFGIFKMFSKVQKPFVFVEVLKISTIWKTIQFFGNLFRTGAGDNGVTPKSRTKFVFGGSASCSVRAANGYPQLQFAEFFKFVENIANSK